MESKGGVERSYNSGVKWRLGILWFVWASLVLAQTGINVGDAMPEVKAETLAGDKSVSLLAKSKGTVAVVLFSFSKEASVQVKAWGSRAAADFGKDKLWQVAVLDGAPRIVRGLILRGMRSDMPKELQAQTLLVYSDGEVWKKRLRFTSDKHAYVVVVDAAGKVKWMHHGVFEERKYEELKATMAAVGK